MNFGSLFSGIGGLDLGLERAGMNCQWQVEIDDYATRVLEKHWPNVRRHRDIRTFLAADSDREGKPTQPGAAEAGQVNQDLAEWRADLICGGFPCQPVSVAGRRTGDRDHRWLWPEFARVIRLLQPRWVLVENVPGLLSAHAGRLFRRILWDLSQSGYDAEWQTIPAAAFDLPHLRERVFVVAHSDSECVREQSGRRDGEGGTSAAKPTDDGEERAASDSERLRRQPHGNGSRQGESSPERRPGSSDGGEPAPDSAGTRSSERSGIRTWRQEVDSTTAPPDWRDIEPVFRGSNHGVSNRVQRVRTLGNAVIPQIAEWIGRQILTVDNEI